MRVVVRDGAIEDSVTAEMQARGESPRCAVVPVADKDDPSYFVVPSLLCIVMR
jgi:hypothetical protein